MKEYKLEYLTKAIRLSRDKALEHAEALINKYAAEGWELQQIVSQDSSMGSFFGVFSKDKNN